MSCDYLLEEVGIDFSLLVVKLVVGNQRVADQLLLSLVLAAQGKKDQNTHLKSLHLSPFLRLLVMCVLSSTPMPLILVNTQNYNFLIMSV